MFGEFHAVESVILSLHSRRDPPYPHLTELINIFESFLPQLLRYPNPADPLNGEAAALLMRSPDSYNARVKEYVKRFAKNEDADKAGGDEDEEEEESDDSDEEMSDMGVSDDEAAGKMET